MITKSSGSSQTKEGIPIGHSITAFAHKGENDYVAECLKIAAVTQGKSRDETVADLQEAATVHLAPEAEPWLHFYTN